MPRRDANPSPPSRDHSSAPAGEARDVAEPVVDPATLDFEAAMTELESIVERIETGEIGLEESLGAYERGVALVRRCRSILDVTEQRVATLRTEAEQRRDDGIEDGGIEGGGGGDEEAIDAESDATEP